eukprot:TRINITY_DN14845_c0_g1_i1.p1 TRINITY_DN14845_c0_g1~~TRINITY_DN14845_c0_g1_i1.p1  ORF type:complete len:231 (+),score=33.72 TRINITY_DN14845_c0_g1_i1:72-764(+)
MPSLVGSEMCIRDRYMGASIDLIDGCESIDDLKKELINQIYKFQVTPDDCSDGGFRDPTLWFPKELNSQTKNKNNTSHITYTYCTLITLKILGDDFSRVNINCIKQSIKNLQLPNGNFKSTLLTNSEQDLRFIYSGIVICSLINDFSILNIDAIVNFIVNCQNQQDGGFSFSQYAESHAGAAYCAIASLSILGQLDCIKQKTKLLYWLIQRQVVIKDNIAGLQGLSLIHI